ncbi:MAG: c-type cytochrome [Gemmatimonadales bacterium]
MLPNPLRPSRRPAVQPSTRLLLAGAMFLLAGCNFWYNDVPSPDDAVKRVPWFDHMIKSRAIFPYQRGDVPRTTVPGTVPITGAEPDWRSEFLAGGATTADRLTNPNPAAGLARGDTLYQFFCSVCHGPVGAGNGTVGIRMGAPSLLTDRARGFSDGYLYSIIRYGRGLMPRYGDKIHGIDDRWAVVNYLRQLQAQVAPPSAVAPNPTPPAAQPRAEGRGPRAERRAPSPER